MTSVPLCIVIDLDGTIIGDISPQIMTFDLAKSLKQAGVKNIFDTKDLRMKLRTGLLRPHFDTFVKSLLSSKSTIEFFVYTASEKSWAELVVKCIEQAIGIKFSRPLFCRNYCMQQDRDYKKSLSYIFPAMLKCLKKKYGIAFSKKELRYNTLLIDNNNVYAQNDVRNLVLCPTYNYKIPENVVANIKVDTFKKYASVITSVLRRYIPLSNTSDYNHFQRDFYTYYLNFLTSGMRKNARYAQDKFWLHMRDVLLTHNVRVFDDVTMRYIKNSLRQRIPSMPTMQEQTQGNGVFAKLPRVADSLKRTFF